MTTDQDRRVPRRLVVAAGIGFVVGLGALAFALRDNTTDSVAVDTPTTTSTVAASTTVAPPTAAKTTAPSTTPTPEPTTTTSTTESTPTTVLSATRTAMWPWPDAATGAAAERFDDPVAAARSFATSFVGVTDPILGGFMQGDSRSGEVTLQLVEDGPLTTVFVRQLSEDDTWWVLGAVAQNVALVQPDALQIIDNEVEIEATAPAAETTARIAVRADGLGDPIRAETSTIGGDQGDLELVLDLDRPATPGGAVIVLLLNEDGNPTEFAAVRILFEVG